MMNPNLGVALFTVIELVALVVWLILAGLPFTGQYEAVLILAIGLFFEHFVSYNVGTGQPPLRFPLRRPLDGTAMKS